MGDASQAAQVDRASWRSARHHWRQHTTL